MSQLTNLQHTTLPLPLAHSRNPKKRRQRSQFGFLRQPRIRRASCALNNCATSEQPAARSKNANAGNAPESSSNIEKCAGPELRRRSAVLLGSVALALATSHAQAANVWINEIHYDNSGTDVNEGVEIAGPAGQSVDGWQLQLYNGGNGDVYRTLDLASSFTDSYNGYGIIHVVTGSLQNGPADGFALIDIAGDVVQFISYEGQIDATGGAAAGMSSTDIGVSQSSENPEGNTLQLIGMGSQASDFSWSDGFSSLGIANFGQSFVGGSTSPVPIPASAWLFGAALAALRGGRRFARRPGKRAV